MTFPSFYHIDIHGTAPGCGRARVQPRVGAAKRGQPCYYLLRARPRAPGCASCWQCALKSCSQRPLRAATSMIIRLAVASLMVASAAGAFFDASPDDEGEFEVEKAHLARPGY